MCGIIGYIGDRNPKGILLEGLKRLEYRGYDSAGIAVQEDDGVKVFRSEGRLSRLEERLSHTEFHSTLGIGHTRWATHGVPNEINAHPHQAGRVTLVHNGIIENFAELRDELLNEGRKIHSDTDSEIIAHLVDRELVRGKDLKGALLAVAPRLRGSYACVLMDSENPEIIVGIHNGAPLLIGVSEKENFLASDVQAVLQHTKRIVYLEDGQIGVCSRNGHAVFTLNGSTVPAEIKTVQWTPEQAEKAGYTHYMLKEIHEQPQALTQTLTDQIDHAEGVVDMPELREWTKRLSQVERIQIVACGTARHAGLIGKYYLERLTGLPTDVDYGSEFRYRNPLLDPKTLLVLISQSGETADTLAGLREGKRRNILTLSICNVRESTMARESDIVIFTSAGPEIGVASTKAFTTQLAALYMLSVQLGGLTNMLTLEERRAMTSQLLKLPILVDKVLHSSTQIESIAKDHEESRLFFYLGRNINFPIALEGALKLKEISYLPAEGYPAGEMKHGPIALIDRHTTAVVICPKDAYIPFAKEKAAGVSFSSIYEKTMSNLLTVKSRGGRIIGIGTEGDSLFRKECANFIAIPELTWALDPILISIPTQLLAYYFALLKGTDIDKPRNLAKSVTVE